MKLNFIAGLLCGTLGTATILVGVYALQDSKQTPSDYSQNSNLPAQHKSEVQRPNSSFTSQENLASQKDISSSNTQPDPRNQKPLINNTIQSDDCDDSCVKNLTLKLVDGADFSDSDWVTIRDISDVIATSISNDPEAIRALRDKISYASQEDEIDGLLSIVGSLPDEQAFDIIRDVSSYSNSHKVLALQTLSGLALYSENATREVENLIIGERDPRVISAALNALESTDNHEFSPQTWQGLSEQFSYSDDTDLKSSILISLAKHGTGDPVTLASNIEEGLNSESSDLQRASIEALGYLISRSENEDAFAPIASSDGLKLQLNAIADSTDADASLRIKALRLLEDAF